MALVTISVRLFTNFDAAKVAAAAFAKYRSLAIQATNKLPSSAVSTMVAAVNGIADGYISSQQDEFDENVGDEENADYGNKEENIEMGNNEDAKKDEDGELNLDNVVNNIVGNTLSMGANVVENDHVVNDDVDRMGGWSDADLRAALEIMDDTFVPIRAPDPKVTSKPIRKRRKPRLPTPSDCPRWRLLADDDHFLSSEEDRSIDPQSQPTPTPTPTPTPVVELAEPPIVIDLPDTPMIPVVRPPSPKLCVEESEQLPEKPLVTHLYIRRRHGNRLSVMKPPVRAKARRRGTR
ncbi:uncharacterized protein LOC141638361 [Silene latifolia]|uniref:uncharacterized protein LOC141638361 n=1 Tax=Silene latifolia TaxID=37657 RepID=UPI003D772E16